MKIEIELSEATAAAIWKNRNPAPGILPPMTLAQAIQDCAEQEAEEFNRICKDSAAVALPLFRAAVKRGEA